MSINYKIKLYYCIIGGPYHWLSSLLLSWLLSATVILVLTQPHTNIAIMAPPSSGPHHGLVLVLVASTPLPSLLLYPKGLWQVGVWWYKNLDFEGWHVVLGYHFVQQQRNYMDLTIISLCDKLPFPLVHWDEWKFYLWRPLSWGTAALHFIVGEQMKDLAALCRLGTHSGQSDYVMVL